MADKNIFSRYCSGDAVCVAFAGAEGAYASIAAKKIFPDCKLIPCVDFQDAYHGVETGKYDFAVLPTENSYAGEVGAVTDLMFSGSLFINRIISLPIRHALLASTETRISDVKTVVSHPQALMQCSNYIKRNGYGTIEAPSTSDAAKYVRDSVKTDISAIASVEAAREFGLSVLDEGINDAAGNTTRFAVFSRIQNTEDDPQNSNFIILFTVENRSGALLEPLKVIAKYGYNMRCLRSRPLKDTEWRYYFYIEAEGSINSENGQKMLSELRKTSDRLKLTGSFRAD